jgi:hypothetical protein
LVAFVPPIIASLFIVRFVDLEPYRLSAFGRYIRRYMTRPVETLRFAGYAVMAAGAWYHVGWVILVGLLVISLAWLRGVLLPGIQ